jgi:hypothetical protein
MRPSLLVAAVLTLSSFSLHATTLYSTGFESPTFTPGALAGQGGFFNASGNSGSVESGVARSGTQGVVFDSSTDTSTASGAQSEIAVAITPFVASPSDETVDVQIAAQFSSSNNNTNYNILALFASNGFFTQVLYSNGQVTYGSGAVAVSAGAWNVYDLELDYTTQMGTAFINGTAIGSETFAISAQDLSAILFGINSVPTGDSAYFDDLSVTASAVPEPSSLALLGTGALALVGAARRRLSSR